MTTSIATPAKVSLVVPTYCERDNIGPLLAIVSRALQGWDHEIIFVDDSSSDGTADVIREAMRVNPRIRLICRRGERGLAGAVIRGFSEAVGEILGSINADLSHDASIMPALIRTIEDGAELAVGSRRIPGGGFDHWPWYRRLTSDVATALTKGLLKVPLSDPMSGFYFLRRTVFERAQRDLDGLGFKLMLELAVVGTPLPICEVPYVFKDRQHGSSKLSSKVAVQFLRMLRRLRRRIQSQSSGPPSQKAALISSRRADAS